MITNFMTRLERNQIAKLVRSRRGCKKFPNKRVENKLPNEEESDLDDDERERLADELMKKALGDNTFKNNKLEELLELFGDRKCKSCPEFGNPLTKDPRKTKSWPLSPDGLKEYDGDYKFNENDRIGDDFD